MKTFRHRLSVALFAFILCSSVRALITVEPMPVVSLCGSPTINVGFMVSDPFNAGNSFTIELSDGTGSFAVPTIIGTSSGTLSGSILCTFPAGIMGGSGVAIRVVASQPQEVGVPYELPITTVIPPNAGVGGTLSVCSSDNAFSLFTVLSGNPQPGGTWTAPNGMATSGIFFPATSSSGCYVYTVTGVPPCLNASASVCIVVGQQADAGCNGSATVCSNSSLVSLFTYLGCSPQPGGVWSGPGPGIGGIHTYTVTGTGSCPDASAFVSLTVIAAPDAGFFTTDTVCITDPPFVLLGRLGGTPNTGGVWQSPAGSPHPGVFVPGLDPPGCYPYTVAGSAPCTNATAILCIVVQIDDCITTGLTDAELNLSGELRVISGWNTDHPIIALPDIRSGEMVLSIRDAMGRELSVRSLKSDLFTKQITLDLSSFSPGVYMITVQDRSQRYSLRIIKE